MKTMTDAQRAAETDHDTIQAAYEKINKAWDDCATHLGFADHYELRIFKTAHREEVADLIERRARAWLRQGGHPEAKTFEWASHGQ